MKRIVALLTLALVPPAFGQDGGAVGDGGGKAPPSIDWGSQEVVVIGELIKLSGGRIGTSDPPTFNYRLEVKVEELLRGDLKQAQRRMPPKPNLPAPGKDINVQVEVRGAINVVVAGLEEPEKKEEGVDGVILKVMHHVRQEEEPKFPKENEQAIVALTKSGSSFRLKAWAPFEEKDAPEARLACSLPFGWKPSGGKALSPWADLEVQWPVKVEPEEGQFVCAATGRPSLDWNHNATLAITKVPSVFQTQFNSRDGDGEIRLKISNFTTEPITIPVLRQIGKRILWKESLVIVVNGRAFRAPGSKGIAVPTDPVRLAPNEQVSTTINPLAIRGADWPTITTERMTFRFCLGRHEVKDYFTYYKEHHDRIRGKLLSGIPLRPEFLGD